MNLFHAVAFVDHQSAAVPRFHCEDVVKHKIQEQLMFTDQHRIGERTDPKLFCQICGALDGIAEVMVMGRPTGLADFRHFVDRQQPSTAQCIVGHPVVDHLSENQFIALTLKYFFKCD
jgi:hypothetical protein